MREVNVLGYRVLAGSKQAALIRIGDRLARGEKTHIITLNSEMVVAGRRDPSFQRVLEEADLIIPDGIGVVWATRFLRRVRIMRIPGIDLAEQLLKTAQRTSARVYLLGAREAVNKEAVSRITERYPGIVIAGNHHGYFQGQEELVIEDIIAGSPDILLVGMGSPGQEFFIAHARGRLPATVMMGVGGSFDIWAGHRKRASRWMQSAGLEWLYRTLVDLGRVRRLTFIPSFVWLVLSAKLTGRSAA